MELEREGRGRRTVISFGKTAGHLSSSAGRMMALLRASVDGHRDKGDDRNLWGPSCRSCGVPSVDTRMRPTCASYRVMAQSDETVRPEKPDDLLLPDEAFEKEIMYFPCLELVVYHAN